LLDSDQYGASFRHGLVGFIGRFTQILYQRTNLGVAVIEQLADRQNRLIQIGDCSL
jgi:hypothetical protein